MKKLFLSIAVLAMTCVAFSSCDDDKDEDKDKDNNKGYADSCTCIEYFPDGSTKTETWTKEELEEEGIKNCSELNEDWGEDGKYVCK
ncbi:MAG: hypothetical protein K2M94_06130 [Paramuribaculum sp.]|nr:hypothetical protein [Paramuribaculum sp.]